MWTKYFSEDRWPRRHLKVCMVFLDLEKEYDRVARDGLWEVSQMYRVGGKVLNDIKSFYLNKMRFYVNVHSKRA